MSHKKINLLFAFVLLASTLWGQTFSIRDIRSFGARGDGRTNDQEAFEKAASYFNMRGGKGKLIISKGIYLVGRQEFTAGKNGKAAYHGYDVFHIKDVKGLTIEGRPGAIIRYSDSLRFGAFNPETGLPYQNKKYFTKWGWAAFIGHCFLVERSSNVVIRNVELDGNNNTVIRGGVYGDRGIQLPHYGVFVRNSREVTIEKVNAHHFALDGISVANESAIGNGKIKLLDSRFEFNGRQGLSWIGGSGLKAKGCSFSHTGRGGITSPPGAGVDIEAEVGPIRDGEFDDCLFINNTGVGLVADNGDSRNITAKECTFWGVTSWSVWVNKPAFIFKGCTIYGSFVHGHNADKAEDATRFVDCHFEDKPYNGREPFGSFLVESNNRKRVSFESCRFVSNKRKSVWIAAPAVWIPEEKYQFKNCHFIFRNDNLPRKDFIAMVRGMRYSNCTFQFTSPAAREKKYYLNSCCESFNVDAGGNKMLYAPEKVAAVPHPILKN